MGILRSTLLALSWLAFAHGKSSRSGHAPKPYYPPTADYTDFMIPVSVAPEALQFAFPKWETDYDLVDFLAAATTHQNPDTQSPITGSVVGAKSKTVLLATHGIGQARSHWNSPFRPEEYNFVQFAVDQGYSVFFYDRLGQGSSQKIPGFVNQINIHVDILKEL